MATRRAPAPTTRAGRGGSKSTVTGKMCVCGCTAANKHPEGFVFFKQHIDYETRAAEARLAGVAEDDIPIVCAKHDGTWAIAVWHFIEPDLYVERGDRARVRRRPGSFPGRPRRMPEPSCLGLKSTLPPLEKAKRKRVQRAPLCPCVFGASGASDAPDPCVCDMSLPENQLDISTLSAGNLTAVYGKLIPPGATNHAGQGAAAMRHRTAHIINARHALESAVHRPAAGGACARVGFYVCEYVILRM